MNVNGVAAVVTGGASGLGEASGRALAAAGARVALLDVNTDGAEAVAKDIDGIGLHCDVTDPDGAQTALSKAAEAHGPAQILINCAGIGRADRIVGRDGPMDLEKYASVIQINLIGTFNMLRLAAAEMSKLDPQESGERGVIINTSSVAAWDGQVGQAAYSSSKGAIASLTLPAARELARYGIRVLAIAPGLFATPMMFQLPEDVQESLGKSVPFPQRLGRPDEYANLVMHMIDNEMLNGEVVRLDGALRMAPR